MAGRDPARGPAPWQLMIRPDVGLEAWSDGTLQPVLFETNATGLAGLYNHAAGVRILRAEVFPRVYDDAEARALADPPDLLALVVRWVRRAARRLGRRRLRGVAFVEDAAPLDGYSEVPRLVAAVRAAGLAAERGTAADLRLTRGGVRLGDMAVDVVYRDLALEDIGTPARPERWPASATGSMPGQCCRAWPASSARRGCWSTSGAPKSARLFTAGERRLLGQVVPWTRVLGARLTEDPAGRRIDLPEFVRRHRDRLLIKPNVGSSGAGLLLGREAGPPDGRRGSPGRCGSLGAGSSRRAARGRGGPWSTSAAGGPTPGRATSPWASSTRRVTSGSTSG